MRQRFSELLETPGSLLTHHGGGVMLLESSQRAEREGGVRQLAERPGDVAAYERGGFGGEALS